MGFFRRWVTNFPFRSPVQQTDQPNGQIDDTFRWIFRVAKVWKAGESSSWCNHDQQEWKKMANWASYVIASPSSKATLTTNKLKVVIPVLFSPTFTGRGCLWCVCQVLNKLSVENLTEANDAQWKLPHQRHGKHGIKEGARDSQAKLWHGSIPGSSKYVKFAFFTWRTYQKAEISTHLEDPGMFLHLYISFMLLASWCHNDSIMCPSGDGFGSSRVHLWNIPFVAGQPTPPPPETRPY